MKKPSERIQKLLKTVYDECTKEDTAVRQRQLRSWRRLNLLWEGYQRIYWSEQAHDWRVWEYTEQSNTDQGFYDKQINVFRAYLESIIAALSVTVPAIKCFPDDAENNLDYNTAKAGDKIAKLIYRHNDIPNLWLHALFTYSTQGMTAFYNYTDKDEKYGTYKEQEWDEQPESHQITSCPQCGYEISDDITSEEINQPGQVIPYNEEAGESEYDPSIDQCESCGSMIVPSIKTDTTFVSRLVGETELPKSRICLEVKGGLNVKVPNYARCQADVGYLIDSYERDYTLVCEEYDLDGPELLKSIKTGRNEVTGYDQYAMWARLSPQYQGEYPLNIVTVNKAWIRPARFNVLDKDDASLLKKKYPHGVCVTFINDEFGSAYDESLDDHWTILYNPFSRYVHFTPLGESLVSVQEITSDLISLTVQTIEHGIGQTFADPSVLDFTAYSQTEVSPGSIFPTKTLGSKRIGDAFYEIKTATLSQEVMPFYAQIQSAGQLTSGALPSLFGGAIEGSETASQYSMSRAQALQRLQNTWKMFCICWTKVFGKVIPSYIKEVKEDERDVERTSDGGFINVFIRKAELEGKIGRVELEANENLPMTWGQVKDMLEKLLLNNNPLIQQIISQPENLPILHEALGLEDLFVPGEQDVANQYDEIQKLIASTPIPTGDPELPEVPSVEIEPDFDNHQIHYEICRKWIISEAGRQTKMLNEEGYTNVLLHAKAHLSIIQQQQMMMASQQASGAQNGEKPNPNDTKEAPITENSDVSAQA